MSVIIFAIFSIITLWIGWKRDFFSFPLSSSWFFQIRWFHVASAFLIYFLFSIFISTYIIHWAKSAFSTTNIKHPFISYAAWVNLLNYIAIFVCLLAQTFAMGIRGHRIWIRNSFSLFRDFLMAITAWGISFPFIVFVNQSLEWIVTNIFHIEQTPDQLAVQFLKISMNYPTLFLIAILSISVLAPLVEEVLFRGFLQSFIRQHLGRKQAIVITSILFSLFHYAPDQKISNLIIITSLFAFSLFLGFVYEKRGSLFAPIFLHSIFNTVNIVNLYFLGKTL